jgi:hypothetical protein
MSTITAQVAPTRPAGRHALRVRRAMAAATTAAAIAVAVGVGATPASAAPQMLPVLRHPLTVALASSAPTMVAAVRAGLEALPNSADIHVDQIVKNVAEGGLG